MSTLHSYCLIILTHHKPFYILLTYFILNSYIHFPIYTIAHYYPITLYLHFILYPSIESNILYFHLIPLHLYSLYIHYNKKKTTNNNNIINHYYIPTLQTPTLAPYISILPYHYLHYTHYLTHLSTYTYPLILCYTTHHLLTYTYMKYTHI